MIGRVNVIGTGFIDFILFCCFIYLIELLIN